MFPRITVRILNFCILFSLAAFVVLNLKNFLGGFWLGLSREANSRDFSWSDHSITLYTKWAAKQPDASRDQKTCVVANNSVANAGGWSDVDCSERNGFICRIRKGKGIRICHEKNIP